MTEAKFNKDSIVKNVDWKDMIEANKDYKKGIIEVLNCISDSDSLFLRRIFIILLYHVEKKGSTA